MALIKDFKDYMSEVQAAVPSIHLNKMVSDDSQLTRYIRDLEINKTLMLGILPNFGNNSPASGDSFMFRGWSELMVVEKTDYSELTDEVFVELFDRTWIIASAIANKLLEDHLSGSCNLLRFLDPASIQVVEVYNKSQCNGWTVTFTFDSSVISS